MLMFNYLLLSLKDWKAWWRAPTKKEDRLIGMFVGAIGGAVIGFILRVIFGEVPAPLASFAIFALVGVISGALLGAAFPKPVSLICAPFAKLLEGF